MKKKNKKKKELPKKVKTFNQKDWSKLSDAEKARVFMQSLRLLDDKAFRKDFGSWEQPDITDENSK